MFGFEDFGDDDDDVDLMDMDFKMPPKKDKKEEKKQEVNREQPPSELKIEQPLKEDVNVVKFA